MMVRQLAAFVMAARGVRMVAAGGIE